MVGVRMMTWLQIPWQRLMLHSNATSREIGPMARPAQTSTGDCPFFERDCQGPEHDADCAFLSDRRIDSFQKLRILLWLYRHPHLNLTCQELSQQLYLSDMPLIESMLVELNSAGLVNCQENYCMLIDQPELRSCLRCLAERFEDPMARQSLIDRISQLQSYCVCQRPTNGAP